MWVRRRRDPRRRQGCREASAAPPVCVPASSTNQRCLALPAADQTYSWEDTSGNQLDVIRVRRFKPCAALGHKTWAVQADWQYQNIAMCAY